MTNRIKEFTQINVNRLMQPLLDILFNLLCSVLSRPSRSVAKAAGGEIGVKDGS